MALVLSFYLQLTRHLSCPSIHNSHITYHVLQSSIVLCFELDWSLVLSLNPHKTQSLVLSLNPK